MFVLHTCRKRESHPCCSTHCQGREEGGGGEEASSAQSGQSGSAPVQEGGGGGGGQEQGQQGHQGSLHSSVCRLEGSTNLREILQCPTYHD